MSKRDRLAAFIAAFPLTVSIVDKDADIATNFLLEMPAGAEKLSRLRFYARGTALTASTTGNTIAAVIDFGGNTNPFVNALPDCLDFDLHDDPVLQALSDALSVEAARQQCGSRVVIDRLVEAMMLIILRRTIGLHANGSGLLAGLAHPRLHKALVAVHDSPAQTWDIERLAAQAGMSRSHFIAQFQAVVGSTPAAYLTGWRLALGKRCLLRGDSVKQVAALVGFGSAAAFSRAFARHFGVTPMALIPRP